MNHQLEIPVGNPDDVVYKKRTDEICMVVLWQNKLLLVTKAQYPFPKLIYRLPTGGVELGEHAGDALDREISEELGTKFAHKELLGIIRFNLTANEKAKAFNSHVYFLNSPTQIKMDHDTEHSSHIWVEANRIQVYIDQLRNISLKENSPGYEWDSWGKVRAATLEFAYNTLLTKKYLLSA